MTTIDDQDIKARLRLAKDKILQLELELEEARDLRDAVRKLTEIVERVSGAKLTPKKKPGHGPLAAAERRAELDRLWQKP